MPIVNTWLYIDYTCRSKNCQIGLGQKDMSCIELGKH